MCASVYMYMLSFEASVPGFKCIVCLFVFFAEIAISTCRCTQTPHVCSTEKSRHHTYIPAVDKGKEYSTTVHTIALET